MSDVEETAATLRFTGDDLDPDEMTRRFGKTPRRGVHKGGIWYTPNGTAVTAKTGMWDISATRRQPGDLDGQIRELLADMTDDLDIWRDFSNRYNGNLFAGLFVARFNEGMELHPETLLALGARGLSLQLDIYKDDDPDEDMP